MNIYVDELNERTNYHGTDAAQARRVGTRNGHQWCHLFADVSDCPELHAFAAKLGMKRAWFDPRDGVMGHYDLVPSKRALAVKLGAIEVDRNGMVAVLRKHREAKAAQETTL